MDPAYASPCGIHHLPRRNPRKELGGETGHLGGAGCALRELRTRWGFAPPAMAMKMTLPRHANTIAREGLAPCDHASTATRSSILGKCAGAPIPSLR